LFFPKKATCKNATPLTITVHNMPLARVPGTGFERQPVSFGIEDKTIFLFKKPAVEKIKEALADTIPKRTIVGIVTDTDGKPLQFVSVAVKSTYARAGMVTLSDGSFLLRTWGRMKHCSSGILGYKQKKYGYALKVPPIRLERTVTS